MLETSTGWRPAQKDKQFYGIHFLTSFFSAISQHCLVPWVSFFQSTSQMSLTSVIESHLGSKWQEARDRKWRKKKKKGEVAWSRLLQLQLHCPPAQKSGFCSFPQGLLCSHCSHRKTAWDLGWKWMEKKGRGKKKSDFLNLWVLGVLFCSSRQN